jgi:hypothetical protein
MKVARREKVTAEWGRETAEHNVELRGGLLFRCHLICFFTINLDLTHNFQLKKLIQHLIESLFVGCPEVIDEFRVSLDVVRRLSEVRDEVKNVNLFHKV